MHDVLIATTFNSDDLYWLVLWFIRYSWHNLTSIRADIAHSVTVTQIVTKILASQSNKD